MRTEGAVSASYDYLNARAKAIKGRLFTSRTLTEFARLDSLSMLVEALAAHPVYAADIRAGDLPETAAGCDAALGRHLGATFRRLSARAGRGSRTWLELWLAPWDLMNLQTLVRAWRSETPMEALAMMWTVEGTLSRAELTKLAASGTIDRLGRRLVSRGGVFAAVGHTLRAAAGESERRLEDGMTFAWAKWASSAAREAGPDAETFARFFGWQVDGQNARNALRLARDGSGDGSFFLPGGARLARRRWEQIASQTGLQDAVLRLSETPFADVVPVGRRDVALDEVDRGIRKVVLDRSAELYERSDPLGIGVLLHVLQLKTNEVENLRLIAYGLERRLPAGLIEEQLTPMRHVEDQGRLSA